MIKETCNLDYQFNGYDFNSLSPYCKSQLLNKKTLNMEKEWTDESSQIVLYILCLFIPFLGFVVKKSIEYLYDELLLQQNETPYEYKYIDEFERLLNKKYKELEDEGEDEEFDESSCDEEENNDENDNEENNNKENNNNKEKKDYYQLFIEEDTPNGKVGLRYNTFTESFWWWSNSKSIPFKYLETVSRKYVIDNDCLDIYVDIRDELQKGIEKANESKKKDETNEQQEKNMQRVYAKFRKYNQKASRILGGQSGAYPVLKERCNRYTYRGNMKDYEKAKEANLPDDKIDVNLDKVLKPTENKLENLTFTEWKKINELKGCQ